MRGCTYFLLTTELWGTKKGGEWGEWWVGGSGTTAIWKYVRGAIFTLKFEQLQTLSVKFLKKYSKHVWKVAFFLAVFRLNSSVSVHFDLLTILRTYYSLNVLFEMVHSPQTTTHTNSLLSFSLGSTLCIFSCTLTRHFPLKFNNHNLCCVTIIFFVPYINFLGLVGELIEYICHTETTIVASKWYLLQFLQDVWACEWRKQIDTRLCSQCKIFSPLTTQKLWKCEKIGESKERPQRAGKQARSHTKTHLCITIVHYISRQK